MSQDTVAAVPNWSVSKFNSAISRCCWPKALQLYVKLLDLGLQGNTVTYNAASNNLSRHRWPLTLHLVNECKSRLLRSDVITINSNIKACNLRWSDSLGILSKAASDDLEADLIAYSSACTIVSKAATRWKSVLILLSRIQQKMKVDAISCSTVITSCQRDDHWRRGLYFFTEFQGSSSNLIMCNAAVSSCERGAQWLLALTLLDGKIGRGSGPQFVDVISFNAAVSACEKSSKWQWALQLLMEAKSHVEVDVITFSAAISACEKAAKWEEALQVYGELFAIAIQVDLIASNAALSACEKGCQWEAALHLMQELISSKLQANLTSHNALLSAFQKGLQWQAALGLFADLRKNQSLNLISYNSVISACVDQWTISLKLYSDLKEDGELGDLVTYSSLISACEKCGQWRLALHFFETSKDFADGILFIAAMTAVRCHWKMVLQLWVQLQQQDFNIDTDAYEILLGSCEQGRMAEDAVTLLKKLQHEALLLVRKDRSSWDEFPNIGLLSVSKLNK